MEENKKADGHEEEQGESEYVLLDLDAVSGQIDIPPNAPYTLSGLDMMNPILIIDKKVKLIGEYEETIGTCFVFSEDETSPVVHEETGPSEANLFSGKCIIDPNRAPRKQVKPVARLHKILKFILLPDDDDVQDETNVPSNSICN
ncbi:general transcription factor 3C polypeptide 6 isoform X2 [Durio zibethinus]|uniref:General transcription factor 3C polypeptide 6 isoform X2 n=1 Tax=Durio zibethinus TaxID=66656 RepID=A0A6P5ZN68_DURZI|nr:general transcription factor 3C polypeptide 6 isoform X2 [Durio zibethinus]